MGWRVVQIVVVLLDVLTVVALTAGQAKQPLFEDRIAAVPEGQSEAEILVPVADAGQAVLVPTVGPRASVIVREVAPCIAIGAVVLAHGTPRALRQEWPPAVPVAFVLPVHQQARAFACVVDVHLKAVGLLAGKV